jgi:dienelactone hydrolase
MYHLRLCGALTTVFLLTTPLAAQPLPGTKPLEAKGDLAKVMVEGIDKYLDRTLAAAIGKRRDEWKQLTASPQEFARAVQPKRERLKKILGVVDARVLSPTPGYVATPAREALVAETDRFRAFAVRWPVLDGVEAEGLLLEPKGKAVACVVALPDADGTPEALAGLADVGSHNAQLARQLAEHGCRVLVPVLIDRKDTWSNNPKVNAFTNQPHREFVYRMAYQMGRHVIGYEVQKVLAAVDWFTRERDHPPVGVAGYGEGGLIALYSAALDPRIQATLVSGSFGPREKLAEEPIYRNVWGLLREFGDAELAALVAPRTLIVERAHGPEVKGPPPARPGQAGAAPGQLVPWAPDAVQQEVNRARALAYKHLKLPTHQGLFAVTSREPAVPFRKWDAVERLLTALTGSFVAKGDGLTAPAPLPGFDPAPRQQRQFRQVVDYTQKLLPEAARRRQDFFWSKLDTSSVEKYQKSTQPLREYFHDEIIGRLPAPTRPPNARTRLIYDEPKWKGYEVVLDVYDDVICYGILLVPKDIQPGERRPVVVCQHGLEGRPVDVVNPRERTRYYHSFGAQLADRGYVVFAPQNPYIFGNQFRQLVRKANPLSLSLYSFILRQHERILDWLATLPFVDASRIAYYGLSYGGKVAMRIPALLGRYCLVICSGDFNEWIWKNITLEWRSSYMFTGEYEMYEFDLGNTFNYAEMAALIAPRPFMVERGHDDGVGLDEYVAFEYAKVRRLYSRLRLPENTAIEFFAGGHVINGQGTFAFLDRHLKGAR